MEKENNKKRLNPKILVIIGVSIILIALGIYFLFIKPNLTNNRNMPRSEIGFNENRTGIPPMNRSDPRFNDTFFQNQSLSIPPEKPQGNLDAR